jgi:hypothetical protein
LAAAEPERLERMIAMWRDMTKNVLHAPANVLSPVREAELPHRHPEWTNFGAKSPADYVRKKGKASSSSDSPNRGSRKNSIRARKNTSLKIVGTELNLKFTGDDPGIAMDLRANQLATGPYFLKFRLLSKATIQGEVLYTTDPAVLLPKGTSVVFPVNASDDWNEVRVELATDRQLKQLRLDIGDGPGEAKISDLQLLDAAGNTLIKWP